MKRIPLVICLLGLFMSGCHKQGNVLTPWDMLRDNPELQKQLRVVPEDCLSRRSYPDKRGFEMWYADVLCSDDRVIMIYFKYGRIYKGLSARAQVVLHVYDRGKPYLIKESDYFDFSPSGNGEGCQVIIGPNSLRGYHPDYTIDVRIEDVQVQMQLTSLIRGYKLTDNRVLFRRGVQSDYNDWIIMVPRAQAVGSLVIGSERFAIQGDAYLDHWLGSAPLNTTYARCHWGKMYEGPYALIFLKALSEREYGERPLGFFMLYEQDHLLAATDLIAIETLETGYSRITGHSYPEHFLLHIQDPQVKGQVMCHSNTVLAAINHVKSHLGGLGWMSGLLKPILGKPYSYGMIGQAQARFELKGQMLEFKGRLFHEIDNKR
ncbi:hypothetical protein JXQ70_08290 [bacterium]|nr:hypothetical protein [bacterium]